MSRTIDYGVQYGGPTFVEYTMGSGVYSSPMGCSYIVVEAVGGGGGGAKTTLSSTCGGSGGGGGYFKKTYPAGSYNYSVGTMGLGYSTQGTNGQSGTATTFNTDSAGGGGRGQLTISGTGGTVTASGALITVNGGNGSLSPSGYITPGGSSFFSIPTPLLSISDATTAKITGTRGGGGGGAVDSMTKAGNGGSGVLLITEYYK